VFAKLYQGENSARSFCLATQIADWLAARGPGVTALRPAAHLAADALILYPQIAGTPLSRQLRRPAHRVAGWMQQIGAALRALHCAPATLSSKLATHDFASEVAAIARASEHVHALLPAAGVAIATILDRARDLHDRLPLEPATFVHGDFKADHLWVTQAGLMLIDFDTCRLADPALDVGKFLADLHWWYAINEQPGLEWTQNQFLTGYAQDTPPARLRRARLYEALVLLKITVRRVRLFDHKWAARTEQFIRRTEIVLHTVATTITSGQ
jgi:aminoglycoside phosphotransferase (APT) family kinase protein